jgi:hypothetical protein
MVAEFFSRRGPGILAVLRSNQRITGVFPELSATAIPIAQELRLHRGDAVSIGIQVQDDQDPPDPVSLAGGVLRWAAKIGFGRTEREGVVVGNDGALILKRSYDQREIEFASASDGQAIIHLRREDTRGLPLSPAVWDLEFTRAVESIELPPGASVQLVNGSPMAIAFGLSWEALQVMPGDLFSAQGRTVLVTKVLSALHLELDFSAWNTGTLYSAAPQPEFALHSGQTKTVASGPFFVDGDVVL